MGYIILSEGLKINPIDFKTYLSSNTQLISFDPINDADRPYSYEWKVNTPGLVEGFLHRDGDSIHIDGEFENCINTAVIIGSFIPENLQSMFFDDSYNYNMELNSKTTQQDILEVFSA